VQQHGDFGDDIGLCSGATVLVSRESMRSDLFEFGMACSENKLEVRRLVSFSGVGCESSKSFNCLLMRPNQLVPL